MKTPQQKGRDYEKKRAKKGLKLTPASGALDHAKEDGTQGPFRLQLKHTEAHSFILKDLDFTKCEKAADNNGEFPGMLVKTRGREYLVIDASWLDFICEKWEL